MFMDARIEELHPILAAVLIFATIQQYHFRWDEDSGEGLSSKHAEITN
jgi:hypothetical protein